MPLSTASQEMPLETLREYAEEIAGDPERVLRALVALGYESVDFRGRKFDPNRTQPIVPASSQSELDFTKGTNGDDLAKTYPLTQ